MVWCNSKKVSEEIRSFELSMKKILLNHDKTKWNWRRTKNTGTKRKHIAGKAYDIGHGGSKATSKWQGARITLHAGLTKISLSRQSKFGYCGQQRGRRVERTNDKYD